MIFKVCIVLTERKDVDSKKSRKNIESVTYSVSRSAMCLKLLATDDTAGCLYSTDEKPDLNTIFNTFDIFFFAIFYFRHFLFRSILYQSDVIHFSTLPRLQSTRNIQRIPFLSVVKKSAVNDKKY